MRGILILVILLSCICSFSQELYVFSEPASNMPANSLSIKNSGKFMPNHHNGKFGVRNGTEMMLGVNKYWMIHAAATVFANESKSTASVKSVFPAKSWHCPTQSSLIVSVIDLSFSEPISHTCQP